MSSTNADVSPAVRATVSRDETAPGALLDLTEVSLSTLGQWDDSEFERAAVDVLRHLHRQDSSVAGHNS